MNTRNNVLARIFGSHEQTDELSGEGGEVTFPLTDEPNQAEIDATQAAWFREAIEERRRAQRKGGQS